MTLTSATMISLTVNDEPRELPAATNVAQLLDVLKLRSTHVAVEVNLQLVPRAQHATHVLSAGDRVEVVTLVGGG
jgi:sulfur carrier protein